MPQQFSDNMGQVFTLELSLTKVREIRSRINLDLLNGVDHRQVLSSLTDRLSIAMLLCDEQIKSLKMTPEAFGSRLYGGGVADKASDAVLEEIENFTQSLGQKHLAILTRKTLESIRAGRQRMGELIKSGEWERMLAKANKAILDQLTSEPEKQPETAGAGSPS